jgi:hypothetical protein
VGFSDAARNCGSLSLLQFFPGDIEFRLAKIFGRYLRLRVGEDPACTWNASKTLAIELSEMLWNAAFDADELVDCANDTLVLS